MIKELCNLCGREAQQAAPNKKWYFQMLPSHDNYVHVKKSQDIDDQRTLQSVWVKGTTDHNLSNQPTFLFIDISYQKI